MTSFFSFAKTMDCSPLLPFGPWQNAPQVSVRLGFSGVEELDPSLFEGLLASLD